MIISSPQIQSDIGEPYLRLELDSEIQAVLPMKYAQEVLIIPHQRLTSVPNMSPHIIGLVSQRNRIYWLVDLSVLLGLNFNSKNVREYNVAFIEIDQVSLGLAIKKIKGVTRISADQIHNSLETVNRKMLPYINGYIIEKEKLIYILNPSSIVNKK
jgi:twitching motility protein PilI